MNKRVIFHTTGYILLLEAVLMLLPMLVAVIYDETDVMPAIWISIGITAAAGGAMVAIRPKKSLVFAREGFVIVALSWVFLSICGCLPFFISGKIPDFFDALFETTSGFTTTGATALAAVEPVGKALLFWRSFTHWIGGMGVLVFMLILLPMAGGQNMHLLRAESPGPSSSKLVPKMRDSARILYSIYLAMTILLIVLLLAGGMPLYDSLINAFGTAGTGGFSNWSDSIAHYHSAYAEIVIGIFMIAFGVNFNIYYYLLIRKGKQALKDEELHWYLGIIAFAVITIALNIQGRYQGFSHALRDSFFQVSSIISSTGFSTTDFNLWPSYSKMMLVMLMLLGASAGSTGGGLKVVRALLLGKIAKRGVRKMIHPRSVNMVRLNGKSVEDETLRNCGIYLIIYCLIGLISMLILSIDNFSFETSFTAVATCFNNIGPGLDRVGPTGNFGIFSPLSKCVLIFDMLAGRLEIFPFMVLFSPTFWRRGLRR